MELKNKEQIDQLAEILGVDPEKLEGVKVLSPAEHAEHIRQMVIDGAFDLVRDYFKKSFLKRIDKEMEHATKLEDKANNLLLALSDLRQKALAIKDDEKNFGIFFQLTEELGAITYAIFVADGLNPEIQKRLSRLKELRLDVDECFFEAKTLIEEDWQKFINEKLQEKNDKN